MQNRMRIGIGIVSLALLLTFHGYLIYHNYHNPNPRLIEWVKTPVNWIDVGLAFMTGAITTFLLLMLAISWPLAKRGSGGPGNGGGSRRQIKLPVVGKVISIEDLKKMSPKGPVQLAPTGS